MKNGEKNKQFFFNKQAIIFSQLSVLVYEYLYALVLGIQVYISLHILVCIPIYICTSMHKLMQTWMPKTNEYR